MLEKLRIQQHAARYKLHANTDFVGQQTPSAFGLQLSA